MVDFQSQSEELIRALSEAAVNATPRVGIAVVFLVVAGLLVRVAVGRIGGVVDEVAGNPAHERFLEVLVRTVLWFGIVLVALSILGFQHLATALGTASGFLALAVAYGLRDVLSEALAGLYLIQDERFVEGARATADGETGRIRHIGLRRTKLWSEKRHELTVIANDRIEAKWTLHEDDESVGRADGAPTADEHDG